MAPALIGLAPEIISLIAGLVHRKAPVVEQQLGAGTGAVKFADVFSSVITSLTAAANAGQISKVLPPDDLIKAIIQAVVSSMQLSGLLGAPVATTPAIPPTPAAQSLTLKSGQSITITVQ